MGIALKVIGHLIKEVTPTWLAFRANMTTKGLQAFVCFGRVSCYFVIPFLPGAKKTRIAHFKVSSFCANGMTLEPKPLSAASYAG
jgi:hypothetical protein